MSEQLLEFFHFAKRKVIEKGYTNEIDIVNTRRFKDTTARDFLSQYCYVVINAGMRNQVAEKIYQKLCKEGSDTIGHEGKRKAIKTMSISYDSQFEKLKNCKTLEEKLEFLSNLKWIGDITKYHLARNLGIDCAKPDRHLERLKVKYGFKDVQVMCKFIAEKTNERIGTVDVILWRYSNLFGSN